MGLASFFVKTFIGGATAVGIGAMIKATKRNALVQKYISLQNEDNYLDIRIMQIGGFCNVMSFFCFMIMFM